MGVRQEVASVVVVLAVVVVGTKERFRHSVESAVARSVTELEWGYCWVRRPKLPFVVAKE